MLLSISGNLAVAASLAEMASVCPIAGAQYHWTYMFAPRRAAPFITRMQGWITVFAWQATATSVIYLVATQTQGLMILNYPSYSPERWHGTLMMFAVTAIFFLVNVYGIRLLPAFELLGGICHVVFFVALFITVPGCCNWEGLQAPRSMPSRDCGTISPSQILLTRSERVVETSPPGSRISSKPDDERLTSNW